MIRKRVLKPVIKNEISLRNGEKEYVFRLNEEVKVDPKYEALLSLVEFLIGCNTTAITLNDEIPMSPMMEDLIYGSGSTEDQDLIKEIVETKYKVVTAGCQAIKDMGGLEVTLCCGNLGVRYFHDGSNLSEDIWKTDGEKIKIIASQTYDGYKLDYGALQENCKIKYTKEAIAGMEEPLVISNTNFNEDVISGIGQSYIYGEFKRITEIVAGAVQLTGCKSYKRISAEFFNLENRLENLKLKVSKSKDGEVIAMLA